MKIIKFRGKSLYSNKIFYGGYYEDCSDAKFIVQPNGEMNRVESVAQLVGYDKNGKEIYSDDAIRVYDCNRYPLTGNGIEDAEDFFKISDIGKTFYNVVLLED